MAILGLNRGAGHRHGGGFSPITRPFLDENQLISIPKWYSIQAGSDAIKIWKALRSSYKNFIFWASLVPPSATEFPMRSEEQCYETSWIFKNRDMRWVKLLLSLWSYIQRMALGYIKPQVAIIFMKFKNPDLKFPQRYKRFARGQLLIGRSRFGRSRPGTKGCVFWKNITSSHVPPKCDL